MSTPQKYTPQWGLAASFCGVLLKAWGVATLSLVFGGFHKIPRATQWIHQVEGLICTFNTKKRLLFVFRVDNLLG